MNEPKVCPYCNTYDAHAIGCNRPLALCGDCQCGPDECCGAICHDNDPRRVQ